MMVIRNLCVLNYAQGFTMWHYRAESLQSVIHPGYFASAAGIIAQGDHVHVSAPDGGAVLFVADSACRVARRFAIVAMVHA